MSAVEESGPQPLGSGVVAGDDGENKSPSRNSTALLAWEESRHNGQGTGGDLQHYQPDRTTRIMAYTVRIEYTDSVREFLEAYCRLLQRAIDEIWDNIRWCEKIIKVKRPVPIPVSDRKRILPKLPMNNGFMRGLRDMLRRDWEYSKHHVDSAIWQAYGILESWKSRYVRGDFSRGKPIIKRRFARIKETTYTFRDGRIKISIRPREFFEIDVSRAWFWSRVPKSAKMGELILRDGWLTITFRFEEEIAGIRDVIAWDLNLFSMDGFNPELGWIRVDLGYLFRVHRLYEANREVLQMRVAREPRMREVMGRFSAREGNRCRDFIEKLTTEITRRYQQYGHVFEDLNKYEMFNGSKGHNREIGKVEWMSMIKRFSDKAVLYGQVDPRYTTQTCPRCGARNSPRGEEYRCSSCNLQINRQLAGAINIYMKYKGIKPSQTTFQELTRNIGEEPNIKIEIMPPRKIDSWRRLKEKERISMKVEKMRREKTVRRILRRCQRILASEDGRLPIPPDGGDVGLPPSYMTCMVGWVHPRGMRPVKSPDELKRGRGL